MSATLGIFEVGSNDSKVTAVLAALHHNGKVLIFHCRSYPMWTRYYDPDTNEISDSNMVVPIWPLATELRPIEPSRIFCAGHCFMSDGKLLVAGGEKDFPYPYQYLPPNEQQDRGIDYCFIFDPFSDPPWIVPLDINDLPRHMADGRWYPSLTILNDGLRILAMGGLSANLTEEFKSKINLIPEFYTSQNGWTLVSNTNEADMPGDLSYYYPAGHLIPVGDFAGKIFFSTTQLIPPLNQVEGSTQIFNPDATGNEPYWIAVGGQRLHPSQDSNHLILPIRLGANNNARIIVFGGAWGTILDTVEMINLTDSNPSWGALDSMAVPRVNHNSIILPDRKILVVGCLNDNGPVLVPEIFDTDTLTWVGTSVLPAPTMEVPRNYHSSALLMQNAKVLLGGGRVTDGGDVENDTERRITIFTPGFLLDGDQPVISVAPSEVEYQETFTVEMDGEYLLDSMAFIKPMSVTHGYNSEQRYIELAFEQVIGPGPANVYSVTAPDNSNIAPPGYYMLFVMKDLSESISGDSRIPSNAVFIKLV